MQSTSSQASSSTPAFVGHTPAWDPCDSSCMLSDLSPAWDPSSRSPQRPKHWLDDAVLQRSRLKLKINDPSMQSPSAEFLGLEDDLVKVRDKMHVKFVALESVSPLLPASKGDLVIPKAGHMQGTHFNVVRIAGGRCVVRIPGTRPTKKNPDPEYPISDLVQVYPVYSVHRTARPI